MCHFHFNCRTDFAVLIYKKNTEHCMEFVFLFVVRPAIVFFLPIRKNMLTPTYVTLLRLYCVIIENFYADNFPAKNNTPTMTTVFQRVTSYFFYLCFIHKMEFIIAFVSS